MADAPPSLSVAQFEWTTPPIGQAAPPPASKSVALFAWSTSIAASDSRRWSIHLCDKDGDRVAPLTNATIGAISEELNGITTVSFTLPVSDPQAGRLFDKDLPHPEREVKIHCGDRLMFWGPVTNRKVSGNTVSCDAADPSWYFTQMCVGGEPSNQFDNLDNVYFEKGLYGVQRLVIKFADSGAINSIEIPTASEIQARTSPRPPGTSKSVRVAPSVDDEPNTRYMVYEDEVVTAPDGADLPCAIAFFVRVPSVGLNEGGQWGDALDANAGDVDAAQSYREDLAAEQIGVRIVRMPEPPPSGIPDGFFIDNEAEEAGETWFRLLGKDEPADPRNVWVELAAETSVPAGETRRVQGRFSMGGLGGSVHIAAPRLVVDYAVAFDDDTDQAEQVRALARHAQGNESASDQWPSDDGKSDLNITCDESTFPDTGINRGARWHWSEHAEIWAAMTTNTDAADGFDLSMEVTEEDRFLRGHSPYQGAKKAGLALSFGTSGRANCQFQDYSFDDARNRVWRFGRGNSFARPLGYAEDLDRFGGLSLEDRSGGEIDKEWHTLNQFAEEALAVVSNPETLVVSQSPRPDGSAAPWLFGGRKGDRCDVVGRHGELTVDAEYRCVGREVDPATERVTLTLERWNR